MFLCLINHYPKKTSLNWESLHGFTYWTCSLNMPWISPLPKHTYISMHVFECQLGLNFTTAWIHAACLLPAISVQWVSFVSVHLYAVCVCVVMRLCCFIPFPYQEHRTVKGEKVEGNRNEFNQPCVKIARRAELKQRASQQWRKTRAHVVISKRKRGNGARVLRRGRKERSVFVWRSVMLSVIFMGDRRDWILLSVWRK